METRTIDILLVGIGGYGSIYLQELPKLATARLCAVVDPFAEKSPDFLTLMAAGVPCYSTMDAFFDDGRNAELAVIVSPITHHAEHACAALAAGMNVLCEKPMCSTVAEAQCMMAAEKASGKFLAIGYQWSYSLSIQRLKSDILEGVFGKPRRFLTYVAWPRSNQYYSRNNWAGRIRDPNGRQVYDSPVNNATAHYLHNMLYLAGSEQGCSAHPTGITAECYRANQIENFDTACCRVNTHEGPEILFYTSHCSLENAGPTFRLEFEDAKVEYSAGGRIEVNFKDGLRTNYDDPDSDVMRKLRYCLKKCRRPEEIPSICGAMAAIAHTICVEGMQSVAIHSFADHLSQKHKTDSGETFIFIPRLEKEFRKAFDQGKLLSEVGVSWAVPPTYVSLPEIAALKSSGQRNNHCGAHA